ncbi:MAG: DUF1844 domain-containing protein [Myxococcota bacterium]|jgi:hypothetical protein|nr:DUF1844 domain-containing protein [Myxococcota bacterium]
MSDEEGKGFKVTDRRIASEEEDTPETVGNEEEAGAASDAADAPAEDLPPADPAGEPIPISFATFIMSLGESAMVHLGVIPNPMNAEAGVDLRSARQTIDILGILEEKTRGNLDEEEGKLLMGLLYTLRMQYVEAGSGAGKE